MNHGWKVLGNIGYTENSQLRREGANSQIERKKNERKKKKEEIREDCITQVASRTWGIKGLIRYICVDNTREAERMLSLQWSARRFLRITDTLRN